MLDSDFAELDRLLERLRQREDRAVLVAVDGRSGVGKTALAALPRLEVHGARALALVI